ncbi:Vacuolar sorting protein 9 (VPS9) domain containing protein [Trypanosoma brucei equiperdum]|uniref:Vacuolar sorting protein 9 (VPS9) domain containing protein n=1 Tax=Trypanosoma brucei equiperdum TaxID=630700 RepID=A0A3L6LAW2_9TRYP|nr:Vacuolar sorting protein 9 (VPS9) domain containing protein [Trypanosoma brucei equiperdum]
MKRCNSESETEFDSLKSENPLLHSPSLKSWNTMKNTPVVPPFSSAMTMAMKEHCGASTATSAPNERQYKELNVDFNDKYFGEVTRSGSIEVPHGNGRLFSGEGKHFYEGGFVNRCRDGYGVLNTERYALWCKWKMNRPDLTSQSRVDYRDGTRYNGFLSAHQNNSAAANIPSSLRCRLSKFSIWVHSLTLVRERWGEIVHSGGDRYFGQWDNDMPSGFGCYVTKYGDRYIGLFQRGRFHDTGTLFVHACRWGNRASKIPDGVGFLYQQEQVENQHVEAAEAAKQRIEDRFKNTFTESCGCSGTDYEISGHKRQGPPRGWDGVIFDGVWEMGRFLGEGHVTLPCGSRITAEWKNLFSPTQGRVFMASSNDNKASGRQDMDTRGWFQCFHWESLLSGLTDESKEQKYAACASFRERLGLATTEEEEQVVLADFCSNEDAIRNALKVFQRCFYFLHGSCGSSSEIGSGWGSNPLGWCYVRNSYGGCIHNIKGRRITACDVDLALTDIISFVRSTERWVVEMLGDSSLSSPSSHLFVMRKLLDLTLRSVYNVLFNLYVHAYDVEDIALTQALERVREHTTLDDLGVSFARQQSSEELFDPYADAVNRIERLARGVWTYGSKLKILAQWSMEIDLSTRLARVTLDDGPLALLPKRNAQPASGSADDLIPIHQFVLMKAKVDHLYVHTKLLVDLSSEDVFMEFTSQENFFVITFQACTMILSKFHPLLRDESHVLAPPSLFEERLRSGVHSIRRLAETFIAQLLKSHGVFEGEESRELSAEEFGAVALGYIKAWLAEAVDMAATHGGTAVASGSDQILPVAELLQMEETRELALLSEPNFPRVLALFCWLAVANVLSVLHIHLGVMAANGDDLLNVDTDPAKLLDDYVAWRNVCGGDVSSLVLLLGKGAPRPLFLRRAAAFIASIL